MKNIALLGSTGSVGRSVLSVVRSYPEKFRIIALSTNENISLLAKQVEEFRPHMAVVGNEALYPDFKKDVGNSVEILTGEKGLREAAVSEADIIFMAISGTAALMPLIAAVAAGKTIALASKEPIVSAGEIIMRMAGEHSARILPVDSEHSAIFQCMGKRTGRDVEKLYITGSGGPLWGRSEDEFDKIPLADILSHPKWDMGKKITVDSATLMNKGLEIIEARWLFDVSPDRIEVIIHPEAIIHSMVEFVDGTVLAGLFCTDMRFPVLQALAYPDIVRSSFPRIDFLNIKNFSFHKPDTARSEAINMAFDALRLGGTIPAVLNGANETAVRLFLDGRIHFSDITKKVRTVIRKHCVCNNPSLDDIVNAEKWAREEVLLTC
ncbi:MAG: 1-deoxy-D-xylulose-5-phosphate reductoisomerase [Candidatus Omnitrophica bacterium]|nr:1-deoxy-D-xylulose-5-phosphate reductoisomerase [Candidatus Omnitrophota bacterium]MBU1127677.1 1-deoxy-D-xylulose-5-phosphate reductoisomerase [Candidatus Omnitrophota bacterium]MBU1784702.1 1-deoxy-D-xylulose-5-phosphate reductoisomerase [Candidatus Omnitrophota bacterium]MBU1851466.1 1-deoxy-D-xylulose-5-phosphate reductoisomerase [Candidatus Omnitrophota bacterium]